MEIAADKPRPDLVLHWAVNDWQLPPEAAWPAGTLQAGEGAVQTPFLRGEYVTLTFPEVGPASWPTHCSWPPRAGAVGQGGPHVHGRLGCGALRASVCLLACWPPPDWSRFKCLGGIALVAALFAWQSGGL